jgi:hypothetical protein
VSHKKIIHKLVNSASLLGWTAKQPFYALDHIHNDRVKEKCGACCRIVLFVAKASQTGSHCPLEQNETETSFVTYSLSQ